MSELSSGQALFGRYAYPPNELGYCGPTDSNGTTGLAEHAREFDGAWPYLTTIADALDASDALREDVVRSYWVGGPGLQKVDPDQLLARLRSAFDGQVTGLLDMADCTPEVLANHSFHVFVVYPWIRFLNRNSAIALGVMQDCRIRWGTVESLDGEHAVIASRPLLLEDGRLTLGAARPEHVQWKKDGLSLAPAPTLGAVVSAHWGWVCEILTDDQVDELAGATRATLNLVNSIVEQEVLPCP